MNDQDKQHALAAFLRRDERRNAESADLIEEFTSGSYALCTVTIESVTARIQDHTVERLKRLETDDTATKVKRLWARLELAYRNEYPDVTVLMRAIARRNEHWKREYLENPHERPLETDT